MREEDKQNKYQKCRKTMTFIAPPQTYPGIPNFGSPHDKVLRENTPHGNRKILILQHGDIQKQSDRYRRSIPANIGVEFYI